MLNCLLFSSPVVVRSNTPYECAVSCKTHPGCNAFSFKDTGECMLTNGLGAILLDDKSSMRGKMSCYFSEEYRWVVLRSQFCKFAKAFLSLTPATI